MMDMDDSIHVFIQGLCFCLVIGPGNVLELCWCYLSAWAATIAFPPYMYFSSSKYCSVHYRSGSPYLHVYMYVYTPVYVFLFYIQYAIHVYFFPLCCSFRLLFVLDHQWRCYHLIGCLDARRYSNTAQHATNVNCSSNLEA